MKILFVINNLYVTGNGLSASVRKIVEALRARGHEVRVISGADPSGKLKPDYLLKNYRLPVFDFLVKKQGYLFAKSDEKIFEKAVAWADVIHLEEPFMIQRNVARIARRKGVPLAATYHLHPENLFASVHLHNFKLVNLILLRWWRKYVFDYCEIVTCPTENVAKRLKNRGFKSELRVISNGIQLETRKKVAADKRESDIFNIVTVGRFSVEKDQKTLLQAMKYSKYSDRIQLYFAGRGPLEEKLKVRAEKLQKNGFLKYPVKFGYYSAGEFESLRAKTDLYVHCAIIEVEGMSCMEFIKDGIVPVIARAELSATSQFALSGESVYEAQDARELAAKVDYWLENEEKRKLEAQKYIEASKKYDFEASVDELEKIYRGALGKF